MSDKKNPFKILIVDDHPATRRLLQDILEDEYEIIFATNGKEALTLLKEHSDTDLILLDIIMPDINGYEVCKTIKTAPTTKDVPVIFLTVMGEEHDEVKGFSSGVADYIIKPISRLRLKARVRNQLQIKHQQQLLQEKNSELQAAMDQINTLQGILPICSYCKQIRNDDGYWEQLEEYIRTHTDATFSHGICPVCISKNFPDYKNPESEK